MIVDRAPVLFLSTFRAYDIRGIVGVTLTEEGVFLIGKAIGSLVRERGEHQVTIARDGRSSGVVLSKALCEGILSVGCDVIDLGMAPTPLLYYTTHIFGEQSGVMLTGSHNPPEYNGLKIVVNGISLTASEIKELYQRILDKRFYEGHGVRHELDVTDRYIAHIKENVTLQRPLKIVIDAGNGVTGEVAPKLFRGLGCEVVELHCEIDGNFPNHHPDPSQPENLQDLMVAIREHQADVGLAFDGDGDRLGVVTSAGNIIWSDRLLMLFAKSILAKQPNTKIIYDVKCTDQLDKLIREHHGEPIMWKTGHTMIKAKMAEADAQLAGEMSGHFFFKDRWYGFDDALYAGARLLEILAEQTEESDAVFAAIPNSINTPELKVSVADEEKFELMQLLIDKANFVDAKDVMTIDGLRVNFADGWGLVRPSNTTPYLILRFEAVNEAILAEIQALFQSLDIVSQSGLGIAFLNNEYDIIIVGGGMVGAALACMFAQQTSLTIAVLESQIQINSWSASQYQHRVSAISLASQRIFQSIQVWDAIKQKRVSPFTQIQVWDAAGKGEIHFDCSEIAVSALGFIIENDVIQSSLLEKLQSYSSQVSIISPVKLLSYTETENGVELVAEDGRLFKAKLAVAADGARSWLREQVGISVNIRDYEQEAIVGTVTTTLPHEKIARQIFLETGPLAFLPLADANKSSIVWSLPVTEAKRLTDLDLNDFKNELTQAFANKLGDVVKVEQRYAYPLRSQQANHYIKSRVVLVGDAAHTVHPLAGQGVNIGLLDAASLVEIISDANKHRRDFSSLYQLRRYERWRKADNFALLAGVDMLKDLFASDNQSIQRLRSCGLNVTDRLPWIKNLFTRHAVGDRDSLPVLARLMVDLD